MIWSSISYDQMFRICQAGDDFSVTHPAKGTDVVLFSFKSKSFFAKKKVRLDGYIYPPSALRLQYRAQPSNIHQTYRQPNPYMSPFSKNLARSFTHIIWNLLISIQKGQPLTLLEQQYSSLSCSQPSHI